MDTEGVCLVGERVTFEGYVGTVKYIGKVPTTSGLWLGINWDDPTKGKHNGSHGGVRYFETTTECSGSFVRPSKCSFGISFMDAVRQKYVVDKADKIDISDENNVDEHIIDVLEHKNVLFVGARGIMKEQSSLSTLKNIILRKCDISRACSRTEESYDNASAEKRSVPIWLPSAVVLDISENLFTDWKEIETILKHLPSLKFLNIQSNKFSKNLPANASLKEMFERVAHEYDHFGGLEHSILNEICLNNLGWNWETVLCSTLSLAASRLESLIVSFNQIDTIDLKMWTDLSDFICWKPFSLVTSLNLEGNPIKSWNEILKLAFIMPSLETLILNSCGINEIFLPAALKEVECISSNFISSSQILDSNPEIISVSNKTTIFPRLAKLSLDRNNISSWLSINELNKLQNLTSLNMSSNPIDEGAATWDKWSHKVAARLSGLTYLNRVKINRLDRRGAEIDYLNFCAQELGITQVNESFLERHPRYNELVSKYGAPDLQLGVTKVAEVKASLVLVNLALVRQSSKGSSEMKSAEEVISVVTRRLPRTMPIERLIMLIKKIFKKELGSSGMNSIDDDRISLSYSSFSSLKSSDCLLIQEEGGLHYTKTLDDRQTVTSLGSNMSDSSFPNNFISPGLTLEIPLDDPFKELGYFSVADQDTLYVRLL